MLDFSWLASEARNIHEIFHSVFYSLIIVLMIIGVFLEYFKIPMGELPSFGNLVGRAFIAAIMLFSFGEFINTLALVTDSLANQIGDLNEFKLVLAKMSEQLDRLTWSWTSVKKMVIVTISFLTFFVLYVSVFLTDALYLYSWTLLYIFSPILIALYVLPATANATKALYKSLFVVASWKLVWSVLATLLWSSALLDLDKLGNEASFLTIIIFNIILAASLLFTPVIVNALMGSGLSSIAPRLGGVATAAGTLALSKIYTSSGLRSAVQNRRNVSFASNPFNQRKRSFSKKNTPKSLDVRKASPKPTNHQTRKNSKYRKSTDGGLN